MSITIVMKSAEVKLVELLNTIREPEGWQAIHFHLSDLMEQYKSEYQIKIATNLMNDLLGDRDGAIYQFLAVLFQFLLSFNHQFNSLRSNHAVLKHNGLDHVYYAKLSRTRPVTINYCINR
mgnify:CR=1 FL=1